MSNSLLSPKPRSKGKAKGELDARLPLFKDRDRGNRSLSIATGVLPDLASSVIDQGRRAFTKGDRSSLVDQKAPHLRLKCFSRLEEMMDVHLSRAVEGGKQISHAEPPSTSNERRNFKWPSDRRRTVRQKSSRSLIQEIEPLHDVEESFIAAFDGSDTSARCVSRERGL